MYWNRDYDPDESLRMQTDITHLAEAKQRELEQITDIIRAQGKVEMVIKYRKNKRNTPTQQY